MFKVTGVSTMPGALSLMSITVFAAPEVQPPAAGGLNRDELSLYIAPEHAKLRHADPPEAGQVERGISALRQMVAPYSAWCRTSYGALKPKVDSVLRCGHESYAYLQNPPEEFYPRAGVIGFLGVVGLLLARRSRTRRVVFPAALMTVGASMYYPARAAEIAKTAGDSVYDGALRGYLYVDQMIRGAPQGSGKTTTTTTTAAEPAPAPAEANP